MPGSTKDFEAKHVLELEGASMGLVQSVEGGGVFAEVVTITLGTDLLTRKHLGPGRFEDFRLEVGLSMAAAFYDWIGHSWTTNNPQRKDGSLILPDSKGRSLSQRDFSDALITETTIPTLDASSKERGWFTVKLTPESIRFNQSSGSNVGKLPKEKQFLCSNFRLEIPGLDCERVSKIESFTVKRKLMTGTSGGAGSFQFVPGKLDFPNLKISLSKAGAQTWIDWADDFITKGNNANSNEKSGKLSLLSPNLKTELARIDFFNLGICRLSPEKADGESIPKYRAELYCERMDFHVN